jgi:hypothetical protein
MPPRPELVNVTAIIEIPNSLQNRFEYNGDGTVLYAGYAQRGVSAANLDWIIHKYTYSGGNVTLKQTAVDVAWNDRASGSYA